MGTFEGARDGAVTCISEPIAVGIAIPWRTIDRVVVDECIAVVIDVVTDFRF